MEKTTDGVRVTAAAAAGSTVVVVDGVLQRGCQRGLGKVAARLHTMIVRVVGRNQRRDCSDLIG